MISVVMASYLGEYKRAAKDRDKKILRAIHSVLDQTVKAELVVVADGCEKTVEIIKKHFPGKINGFLIPKQPYWYGLPRNLGIEKAQGEIICYLDIDDYLERDHCEKILDNFTGDWVWFDDVIWARPGWKVRKCDINRMGACGTSNIAHKKYKIWPERGGYAHDWHAIKNLKKMSTDFTYIGAGGYRVAHVPGRWDV